MKRVIVIALLLCLALSLGCSPKDQGAAVRVAALKGPTGMGLADLMAKAEAGSTKNQYTFTLSSAPDEVTAAFLAGEIDIAAVPINLASVLYNKMDGGAKLIAVNTLGVLYILEKGDSVQSLADLEGKTLYATGQGSTPEYVLNYLLAQSGVNATVKYVSEHGELAALMAAGEASLGMLPEPNVTAVTMKNPDLRIALDLTEEWNKLCDTQLIQGCFIVRSAYLEENQAAVKEFLSDYEASVQAVNSDAAAASILIEKYEIMASAAAAEKALPNCNIVCMTGDDMKDAAENMLTVLFEANAKSVGGALPGEEFYW